MTDQNLNNQQLPLVALIGPTNAGKSTLFNRLTSSHQSITAREISTTRDRVYGEVEWFTPSGVEGQGLRFFTVVDTGGLVDDESELYKSIHTQTLTAVDEADIVLFMYDAREGLQPRDQQFVDKLRGKKTVWLVANKVDSISVDKKVLEVDYLGLPFYKISASSGKGVGDLLDELFRSLPQNSLPQNSPEKSKLPVIALVGRPNVGKSTILNALTKTDRAVVSSVAGTTRDVVTAKLKLGDREMLLADTAGVRKRGKIIVGVEKFSVKRTLAAINFSSAVMIIVDAFEGTTRSDLHLIYYANSTRKPVLLVFNKSDLLEAEQKPITFHHHLAKFKQIVISAKDNKGLDQLTDWLMEVSKNSI